MGEFLSKPSPSAAMSEKPAETKTPNEKRADPIPAAIPSEKEGPKADEEEEGECGFCLFMKAGGCKDTFTAWEACVAEGEKNKEDIVNKCHQETTNLKNCMEAHPDYYAPLLQAEKAAEEEGKEGSDLNNLSSSSG